MLRVYEVEGLFEKRYSSFAGYPGFAIRGAFGYALKKLVCRVDLNTNCKACKHYRSCIYALIFEPSSLIKPDAEIARKGGRRGVTRPFVIKVGHVRGSKISFSIVLMGSALEYEHVVVMAVIGMGFEGLGLDKRLGERRKFKISRIKCLDVIDGSTRIVYAEDKGYVLSERPANRIDLLKFFEDKADSFIKVRPKELKLTFTTPTNIRSKGQTLITPSLRYVIANLARKYSLLAHYFGIGKSLRADEAKAIIQGAEAFSELTSCNVRKMMLRKSSIKGYVKILGDFIVGSLSYRLNWKAISEDIAKRLIALLLLGKYIHVGNLTTAGCGEYDINLKF
ncbi:MAG: hypothetical protein DRJ60_05690 [Thermoprotei archaeon]|nr:MAG: hypothetical protein DRJ60_05690 [Thermoprotei archaeon]